MSLDWIANPLTLTALLGAGLIACLTLFAALKKEFCESEARHKEQFQALAAAADQMRAALEQLQQDMQESREQSAVAARPVPGMNLNRRGQVLRMYRRGEKPEQIAAALSIPLSEVELLVKVHRTVVGRL